MSQGSAIVIAAVLSGLIGATVAYRKELHEAHRNVIGEYVVDLGEAIHEVVALSNTVFQRAQEGQPIEKWLRKAKTAAADLKGLRRQVRYPLWGIDQGLRTLARLPDWIAHVRHDASDSKRLLEAADDLSDALDEVVRKSYRGGRPPRFYESWYVKWYAQQMSDTEVRP